MTCSVLFVFIYTRSYMGRPAGNDDRYTKWWQTLADTETPTWARFVRVGNRVKAWGCKHCISCFWNACVLVLHSLVLVWTLSCVDHGTLMENPYFPKQGWRKRNSYSILPFNAFLCFILQMLGISSTVVIYLWILESKVTGYGLKEKGWHSLWVQ